MAVRIQSTMYLEGGFSYKGSNANFSGWNFTSIKASLPQGEEADAPKSSQERLLRKSSPRWLEIQHPAFLLRVGVGSF